MFFPDNKSLNLIFTVAASVERTLCGSTATSFISLLPEWILSVRAFLRGLVSANLLSAAAARRYLSAEAAPKKIKDRRRSFMLETP
jgi:hypothetical protein